MDLPHALRAAVAVYRTRPGDFLPVYFLGAAIPIIARVIPIAGLLAAIVYLELTGRLAEFWVEVAAVDFEPPAEPGADTLLMWFDTLLPLLDLLFPPVVIVILVLTTIAFVLGFLVLHAAVHAGQIAACNARLHQHRGLPAAITGAEDHWQAILRLRIAEGALWLALLILPLLIVTAAASIALALGVLAAFVVLAAGLLAAIAIRAIFVFAPVAVVIDDAGALRSIRRSIRFIRHHPVEALGYYVLAVVAFIALASLSATLTFIGGTALVAVIGFAVLAPSLDLVKTGLYADTIAPISPPTPPTHSLTTQTTAGIRRGWTALTRFVAATPGLHALALGVLLGGFWTGWLVITPLDEIVQTSIDARLTGTFPPTAAVDFATNNWTVAITMAYGGLGLAIPSVVSLLINGIVLGAFARLEVAPLELLAFVIPHGIIEIPAILVSGALGFYLGIVGWRVLRGHAPRLHLADAMERAFWVLVGIGILLAIAGTIEGFISPFYWRPFL